MENLTSSPSSQDPRSRSTVDQTGSDVSTEQQTASSSSTSAPSLQTEAAPSSTDQQSRSERTPSTTSNPDAAPTTTLWENFMASLRNVVHRSPSQPELNAQPPSPQGPNNLADAQAEAPTLDSSTQPATPAQSNSAQPTAGVNRPVSSSADLNGPLRPPVFFRLPFSGPDGNPALLAFHPQPLPERDSDPTSRQPQTSQSAAGTQSPSTTSPPSPHDHTGTGAGATSANPHTVPHAAGHIPVSPLFVPFGASPLPFSFIYDASTQTAWPIAQVTPGSPPGGPAPDAPESQQPRLVAGPPFRIILDIHFGAPPEPEQADPEKAANYVKQLERADAELRARMARLGMGSIGGFADPAASDDQDALLGCGVCLDNYEAEDRPEWIDGPKSQDEAVVAVPCPGHHTLHAGCLRDWLAKLPPSQWTCPFCRASLGVNPSTNAAHGSSPKAAAASTVAVNTSLRDEVRAREFQRGWRCQAPACLPRYPVSFRTDNGHLDLPETSDDMTIDLIKLSPCRHEVHLDCLCTSMRVENDLVGTCDLDDIMGNNQVTTSNPTGQDDVVTQAAAEDMDEDQASTVGKWVTCPTCRKECWAELPLRRKPQRSAPELPVQQAGQTTASEGLAALQDGVDATVVATEQEMEADYKAPHVAQTSSPGQISGAPSRDRDEEAAVNAMLLPLGNE